MAIQSQCSGTPSRFTVKFIDSSALVVETRIVACPDAEHVAFPLYTFQHLIDDFSGPFPSDSPFCRSQTPFLIRQCFVQHLPKTAPASNPHFFVTQMGLARGARLSPATPVGKTTKTCHAPSCRSHRAAGNRGTSGRKISCFSSVRAFPEMVSSY